MERKILKIQKNLSATAFHSALNISTKQGYKFLSLSIRFIFENKVFFSSLSMNKWPHTNMNRMQNIMAIKQPKMVSR